MEPKIHGGRQRRLERRSQLCADGPNPPTGVRRSLPTDTGHLSSGEDAGWAPASYWTHLTTQIVSVALVVRKDLASEIPPGQYPLIHDAVLRQCDTLGGVKDGLLEDPRRCAFKPALWQCRGADEPTGLTAPQVAALEKVYAQARRSNGAEIFPGLAVGGELGWGYLRQPIAIAESH